MQVTGNITNIQPDGGYDSQGGYIHTFQMTVQGPNGPVTGQIGSKSAVYPMQVGQEITVDMSNGQHGPKLKKINTQYNNQSGGQQSQGEQGQGSAPPRQNASQNAQDKPDWDKIAEGKVRHGIVCAAIQSGQMPCKNPEDVKAYVDLVMDKPASTGFFNAEEQKQHDAADGVGGKAGPGAEDIPF